jgi:chromosome segregation ATPase
MYWWIAMVVFIGLGLLVQYICSNKVLRLKQRVSQKSIALRDARLEAQKLDDQEAELKGQQVVLAHSISRLQHDIQELIPRLKEKGLSVPQASFPLEDPGGV